MISNTARTNLFCFCYHLVIVTISIILFRESYFVLGFLLLTIYLFFLIQSFRNFKIPLGRSSPKLILDNITCDIIYLTVITYLVVNSLYFLNLIKPPFYFLPFLVCIAISLLLAGMEIVKRHKLLKKEIIPLGDYKGYLVEKQYSKETAYFMPLWEFDLEMKGAFFEYDNVNTITYFLPFLEKESKSVRSYLVKIFNLKDSYDLDRIKEIKFIYRLDYFKRYNISIDFLYQERKSIENTQKAQNNLLAICLELDLEFLSKIPLNHQKKRNKKIYQIVKDFWLLPDYELKNKEQIDKLNLAIQRMSHSDTFKERILVYEQAILELKKNYEKINNLKKVYASLMKDYLIEELIGNDQLLENRLEILDNSYGAAQEEYNILRESIKEYSKVTLP